MASLATAGVIAGRRTFSLRGLGLAAMVLLLASPELILSVSFQMSFSAVAALIAGHAALQTARARRPPPSTWLGRTAGHVLGLGFTSLLAGGASMPFAAYQFQQLEPYWIPANLVAVPLTAFWIMPWGLLALALMPFHLAALALIPMGWGIAAISWLTGQIAGWPDALLHVTPMPATAILLLAAGLTWLCVWRSAARLAAVPVMALGVALALTARPPDVLVSADARLIAIRNGETVFLVAQPKASHFTRDQWQNLWGAKRLALSQCSAPSCRIGGVWYTTAPVCAATRLIAAPIVMPPCAAQVIDRLATYRNGAIAAWLRPTSVVVLSDRQVQGERPWVQPYPQLEIAKSVKLP